MTVRDFGTVQVEWRPAIATDDPVGVRYRISASPGPEWTDPSPPLKARFRALREEWEEQVTFVSSTTARCMAEAYQKIIGLGAPVLPLLLADLRDRGGDWFWALKAISGSDPVPVENRGRWDEMRDAWLAWGRRQGLI